MHTSFHVLGMSKILHASFVVKFAYSVWSTLGTFLTFFKICSWKTDQTTARELSGTVYSPLLGNSLSTSFPFLQKETDSIDCL